MNLAVGHRQADGFLDEHHGAARDHGLIDRQGPHRHHLAAQAVEGADALGAGVVERGLHLEVDRAGQGPRQDAGDQVAQRVALGVRVGGKGGEGDGHGRDGQKSRKRASHRGVPLIGVECRSAA